MNDQKRAFVFSLIPSSVPLIRDAAAVLAVTPSANGDEIVVLNINPTAAVLATLQRQRSLPKGVHFEATVHVDVDKTGINSRRPVLAVHIAAAPFRVSPYTFWFAAYPRAVAIYAIAVLLLAGVWLLLR